jgi:hypothetical protein
VRRYLRLTRKEEYMTWGFSLSLVAALALGCRSGTAPDGIQQPGGGVVSSTGLEGIMLRGPTRPVCQVDEPCSAPFRAGFEVWQSGQIVARFQSDAEGHFLIHLPPGTYMVAPDKSAPLLARADAHEVTVGSTGLTHVELEFDTGIR